MHKNNTFKVLTKHFKVVKIEKEIFRYKTICLITSSSKACFQVKHKNKEMITTWTELVLPFTESSSSIVILSFLPVSTALKWCQPNYFNNSSSKIPIGRFKPKNATHIFFYKLRCWSENNLQRSKNESYKSTNLRSLLLMISSIMTTSSLSSGEPNFCTGEGVHSPDSLPELEELVSSLHSSSLSENMNINKFPTQWNLPFNCTQMFNCTKYLSPVIYASLLHKSIPNNFLKFKARANNRKYYFVTRMKISKLYEQNWFFCRKMIQPPWYRILEFITADITI